MKVIRCFEKNLSIPFWFNAVWNISKRLFLGLIDCLVDEGFEILSILGSFGQPILSCFYALYYAALKLPMIPVMSKKEIVKSVTHKYNDVNNLLLRNANLSMKGIIIISL